jgi:phage tail sheath gpL-like
MADYAVPFQNIPANLRIPLFFAELNNSQANTNQQTQRALVIGQMTAAGTATPNLPVICSGSGDAAAKAGAGSMLALMAQAYIDADAFGEVWLLPLSDAAGATAAAGAVAFTGAVTANGTLFLYIAGELLQVALTAGMTAAQVATAVEAALAAANTFPVSGAVTAGTIALTALNKGLAGNDIDLRLNYLGTSAGQTTPAGLTVTLTPMSGGATNPTLSAALANLSSQPFDFIVQPYNDATSLAAMTSFLGDVNGRWSWQSQVYGHAFGAYRGAYGALATYGATLNDQHNTEMGFYDSPTPSWIWAADIAGTAAVSLRADPALPLQTLTLSTALAPPIASQFDPPERNTLLYDGISTFTVSQSNQVQIENLITTYQKNAQGTADDSYLQVETMFTLMAVLRTLKSGVTSTFGRCKLVANGTRIPAGSNFVTPNTIRAYLIALYQSMSPGLVQDVADFSAGLVIQQNANNPSRVDVLFDPILTGGLRTLALLAQFMLMPPAAAATS